MKAYVFACVALSLEDWRLCIWTQCFLDKSDDAWEMCVCVEPANMSMIKSIAPKDITDK